MNLDGFERVGRDAQVVRVIRVSVPSHFDPLGPSIKPDAFNVTSTDEKFATERREPPHLSVFDLARTTRAQAVSIRNGGKVPSEPLAVFQLIVADIEDAMTGGHVRRFPRPELGPAGDGHCGILGLHKDQQPNKAARLAFKDALSALAKLLPDGE